MVSMAVTSQGGLWVTRAWDTLRVLAMACILTKSGTPLSCLIILEAGQYPSKDIPTEEWTQGFGPDYTGGQLVGGTQGM